MASKNKQKRGRQETSSSSDEETLTGYASRIPVNNWPEFILIQPDGEKQLTSNPFMTAKVIQGIAGEVRAVKSLRNGDILVHCALRSHALNLLKLKAFAGITCKVSPHRSLNSSKGIIRDRERCLQSMTEETITKELADQGVIHVKRFTVKTSAGVTNTNIYLMTFSCASLPQAIKAGYHNIKVEVYIPNPLRCYKCQRYGHGAMRCTNGHISHRCGGNEHEGSDCKETPFCCNCKGSHMASSKECPIWIRETAICKLKVSNNISFPEARKLYFNQNKPTTSATANSYAAAAKAPQSVASVACQTNLTWIDSPTPMQRPSLTLTKSITTKTNSSCQTTPISAFSQPSSDVHSQSAAKTASSLIKSTSKTTKSSKPSQPSTSRSKSSSSTSKSSSSPSQHSKGKTDKPAKVQSGRPHKGEDDPIKSYNRFSSLEEMELDKTPPTSRHVSVSPRRGRRMSPLKHPS